MDGKEVGLAGEGVTCTLDVAAGPAATTSTTVTLGTLMAQFGPKPARALKIDVEGSETEMFRRQSDIDVLRNAKFVVAEVHSELAYNWTLDKLERCGFTVGGPRWESDYMLGLVRELARDPILAARLYGKAAIPVAGRILSGSVEHARGVGPGKDEPSSHSLSKRSGHELVHK